MPGTVANPAGRPPESFSISHEIANRTSDLNTLLDFAVESFNDEKIGMKHRIKLLEFLFNYALGKPKQMIDVTEKSISIIINQDRIEHGPLSDDEEAVDVDIEDI